MVIALYMVAFLAQARAETAKDMAVLLAVIDDGRVFCDMGLTDPCMPLANGTTVAPTTQSIPVRDTDDIPVTRDPSQPDLIVPRAWLKAHREANHGPLLLSGLTLPPAARLSAPAAGSPLIQLSRPGFSNDRRHAVVTVRDDPGGGAGHAYRLLLTNTDTRWHVDGWQALWIE